MRCVGYDDAPEMGAWSCVAKVLVWILGLGCVPKLVALVSRASLTGESWGGEILLGTTPPRRGLRAVWPGQRLLTTAAPDQSRGAGGGSWTGMEYDD